MPICSRLLRSAIILISCTTAMGSWAASDAKSIKPASTNATANSELPFDNRSIPKAATTSSPETIVTTEPPTPGDKKTALPQEESGAEVHPSGNNQCRSGESNLLQKSLLVTAFPRINPGSSNAGALNSVEHELPQLLSQQLVAKHKAIAPVQISESLPSPAGSSDNLLAQHIQKLARSQHTQLVLTGDILDMSMAHQDATYNPGLYRRFLNGVFDLVPIKNRFDKRDRIFSFEVNLRDGFTGQTLFTKRYDTYGIWALTQNTGFGTPLFWKSDYGQQIQGLIKMASKEVGAVIQCQPFMAQIDSRPGQTQILLQGGANNGLHSGDSLALYQMVVQGSDSEYDQHQVRLVNRNAAIELREVYPSHSIGVINGTTYLTGQFLAVSP